VSNISLPAHHQIKEVLNNFDFHRVHDIMEYLSWEYAFGEGHNRVPTAKDLEKHVSIMLMYVARGNTKHLQSGGFSVEQYYTSKGQKISLEFVVESFESKPI